MQRTRVKVGRPDNRGFNIGSVGRVIRNRSGSDRVKLPEELANCKTTRIFRLSPRPGRYRSRFCIPAHDDALQPSRVAAKYL